MNEDDLQKNPYIIEWFSVIGVKEKTKRNYLTAIQNYTEYTKMSVNQLIKEAKGQINACTPPSERKIKKYVAGFRNHLIKNRQLARNTVRINMNAIHSFYSALEIDLPRTDSLLKNQYIIEWFDIIDAKENTKRNYLTAMQYYTEYTNMSVDELVKEARDQIKAGIYPGERSIKRYFVGFRNNLIQELKLAPNTVRINMNGICSFYGALEIDLPRIPKLKERTAPLYENTKIPTKEDWQEVLKVCDHLERAIVLVGLSSGLSMNEIAHLKISHFNEGYEQKTGITRIEIRREKEQVDFFTFLTPESSTAVKEYLDYRDRTSKNSRWSSLEKQKVRNDDGYLFIQRHIPDVYLKNYDEELRFIDRSSFVFLYRAISDKAQKSRGRGHWNLIRSHNARKFFYSTLVNQGCDNLYAEFWMGHTIDKVRRTYMNNDPEYQKKLYQKYIPYLTLQKELDISVSSDYLNLLSEMEIMKLESERHIIERKELQDLRAEVEKVKTEREEEKQKLMDEQKLHEMVEDTHQQQAQQYNAEMVDKLVEEKVLAIFKEMSESNVDDEVLPDWETDEKPETKEQKGSVKVKRFTADKLF